MSHMVLMAHWIFQNIISRIGERILLQTIFMENLKKKMHKHLIVKLNLENKMKIGFWE